MASPAPHAHCELLGLCSALSRLQHVGYANTKLPLRHHQCLRLGNDGIRKILRWQRDTLQYRSYRTCQLRRLFRHRASPCNTRDFSVRSRSDPIRSFICISICTVPVLPLLTQTVI